MKWTTEILDSIQANDDMTTCKPTIAQVIFDNDSQPHNLAHIVNSCTDNIPIHYSDSTGTTIDLTELDTQFATNDVIDNECFGELMTGNEMDLEDICTDLGRWGKTA